MPPPRTNSTVHDGPWPPSAWQAGQPSRGSKTRLAAAAAGDDGVVVRGYGQYCPIALAAEIFAERWTPIIVRNIHLGCDRFSDILDGAPGLPRSVLTQRLRLLEREGVIARR